MHDDRPLPRRSFLTQVAATIATCGMGLGGRRTRAEGRQGRRSIMLDQVTVAEFSGCLGSTFSVYSGGALGIIPVELIEATGLGSGGLPYADGVRREPFSLIFRGSRMLPLSQGNYPVKHDKLGAFALFLVPIGPSAADGKQRYQAIFS